MAKQDVNSGPGLRGIFTGGEPAYSYQGPLGIDEAQFTKSALERMFDNTIPQPDVSSIGGRVLATPSMPEPNAAPWNRIAGGKRYQEQAKNLNDMYALVKAAIRLRNPAAAESVAPLVLQDAPLDEDTVALYLPDNHRILHPVYNVMPVSGYEGFQDPYVTVNTSDGPVRYRDSFVPANANAPEDMSYNLQSHNSLAHEIGHSLDYIPQSRPGGISGLWNQVAEYIGLQDEPSDEPKSQSDRKLWQYMFGDNYLYPRPWSADEGADLQEVFGENFAHAMRSELASKMPELQAQYAAEGKTLPYQLVPVPDAPDSTAAVGNTAPYIASILNQAKTNIDAEYDRFDSAADKMALFSALNTVDIPSMVRKAYDTVYDAGNQYLAETVPDSPWKLDPTNIDYVRIRPKHFSPFKDNPLDFTSIVPKQPNSNKNKKNKNKPEKHPESRQSLNRLNRDINAERAKRHNEFMDYFLNSYFQ